MPTPSHFKLQQRLTRYSVYLAILLIIIAGLVLVGWEFDIILLKQPLSHLAAMNPTTAVAFIFSGAAFLLYSTKSTKSLRQLYGNILSVVVLLTGLLKFTGIIFGFDAGIDALLFSHKLQLNVPGSNSSSMAPNTSVCFIFTGTALLLLKSNSSLSQKLAHILALIIALVGLFSVLGYLYRVQAFYGVLTYIPMAFLTAWCFLLMSFAILFRNPDKGIMKDFTAPLAGSVTARLLIPVAIIMPVILGYLRLIGYWAGLFNTEFGVAILVLSIIIVFIGFIWYHTIVLNRKDILKQEAEKSLRQSEMEVQTIFNAAPDAVIVIDEEGKIVKWNPKAESLFDWTAKEIIGKYLSDTIIPHRYREAHQKGLQRFLETGERQVIGKTIEVQAITKSNTSFDVALSISPALLDDKYLFIGFIRDITAQKKAALQLKESEEKFQKAFQSGAAGISLTRLSDSTYIEVNDAFIKMTGYSRDELINHNSKELGMVTDLRRREEILQQIREYGSMKSFEMTVYNKSGGMLEVLASVETILLNGEKYVISIIYDITERKRAEKQLEIVNKELEAFSYSVSHDLRAPLRIIDGYAEILKDDYGDKLGEEGGRMLGIIKDNARKMGKLIDALLNLSRLGRKELIFHSVDMNAMVESVIAEQQELQTKPYNIKIAQLDQAYCESNLIRQVWVNLISNAIKYSSGKDHPEIEINSFRSDKEIVYSIKDNGAGFNMQYADKLFGVFQRLHKVNEYEGIGVGLALVHRIISRHGGRVWAEAEVDKGASFYFSLPRNNIN